MLKPLDRSEVARYMGYRGRTPDESVLAAIGRAEQALFAAAGPLTVWRRFPLAPAEGEVAFSGTGVALPGADIARHLQGCSQAILMAATLGAGADVFLRKAGVAGAFDLLVADACATAAIEQVCDTLEAELRQKEAGGALTTRFSPGYGDLPLTLQGELLRLLDAQRQIGLTATGYSTLVPSKSVTAILGIKEFIPGKGAEHARCVRFI